MRATSTLPPTEYKKLKITKQYEKHEYNFRTSRRQQGYHSGKSN
jgi:hypothetical protein